jgi:hypothetical protein
MRNLKTLDESELYHTAEMLSGNYTSYTFPTLLLESNYPAG